MSPAPSDTAPRVLSLRTPEGVVLPFTVATAGDRMYAFFFDLILIGLGTVLAVVAAAFLSQVAGVLAIALALLVSFLLWNFYFIVWEVRRGTTPGKRRAGLRVISRDGGPLTADAVFARNLLRDLEFFLPLSILLFPGSLVILPGWGRLLAVAWIFVFALMPLFNKDRLRCGDLVAGTAVVRVPAAVLLRDLAEAPDPRRARPREAAPEEDLYSFTREQLDIYGIRELQVLENLLRHADTGTADPRLLDEVRDKIQRKIDWPRRGGPARPFLDAFYRAQRARLEQKMLFGQRQEQKKG
ncbi:MAG TPA: RDD family protein [Thermoanaerobaculia bacterium]|nr:RDD family protein [Thermoanaerobaculia bacterium]